MFHLAGYFKAIDNTADTDIPAIVDDILTIQNNHFVLQQPLQLLGAAAMSATISRAKLASPSMRQVASPYIRPLIGAVIPPANPNVWLLDHSPFTIPPFEEVQCQATSAISMSTENFTALAWLSANFEPCPIGNWIPLRFTSTTTAVVNTWTSITITFTDTIPSGVYAMCLSECKSTGAQAHRWIISNQTWRPGYLSFAALTSRLPNAWAKGQLGLMGRFRSNDLPRLQVLCNSADTSHEGYLHVVKVGTLAA